MSTPTDIGTLITRSPEIRGGRPRIAGTGVTVRRIASRYQLGLTAEEIADSIGHISVGQVYAALAYYHANRDEIDADLQRISPKVIEEDGGRHLKRDDGWGVWEARGRERCRAAAW